jgi:hypothetical protein
MKKFRTKAEPLGEDITETFQLSYNHKAINLETKKKIQNNTWRKDGRQFKH